MDSSAYLLLLCGAVAPLRSAFPTAHRFAQSGALPRRNRSAIRSANAPLISGYLLLIAGASPPAPPPPFYCSASADAPAITKEGAGVARSANSQAPPCGQGLVSLSGAWVLPRSPPLRSSV